jgi:putative flippase GtrA
MPHPPATQPSRSPRAHGFARYAIAGAIGTAFHFAILAALVQLADISAVAASTIGAIVGALVNYALNYRFTFGSQRMHRVALPRFVAVALGGIALNAAVLAFALGLGVYYLVGQAAATGVVLIAGFLANRKWTF